MKKLLEFQEAIDEVLSARWQRRSSTAVPEAESVRLGNDAVEIDGTVLYADLVDSTGLVQGYKDWFAAEVYKVYLMCASELIKNNGGTITAFDGDRVMGVFTGGYKNSSAAKCALQINHMVSQEINPRLKTQYPNTSFELHQAVGVDTSKLLVARTGVRGANDLVWVGRAANYAAKLCGLRDGVYSSFITSEVFRRLSPDTKFGGKPPQSMWTKITWEEFGTVVYRSSWRWEPD
jgi:class 3 adenylate cyclase